MFEIKPKLDTDLEEFNEKYVNVKAMIDDLISCLDKSESKLDKAIKKYDYDKAYELLDFLCLCTNNYTVVSLMIALEAYCHQLEDEAFLNFYSAVQCEDFDSWLNSSSLSDLKKLKRCFQNFDGLYEIFPKEADLIIEKEKTYHI